ncbi:MAG TPA: sulfurtransferase-like selenium metabolism protein YedF [Syntrophales bacterium]|nr:sulfurtransferase-like selenium metabolism protein YedF [Syntrophales bacterium]
MNEREIVDARGLGCPQPVILAKRALEREASVVVIVDNEIARENVRRLGVSSGCDVQTEDPGDGTFRILLTKRPGADPSRAEADLTACGTGAAASGPFVIVLSSDRMGEGSDELGGLLVRTFLHVLGEQERKPDAMIFYNGGVRLTVKDSPALEDLKALAAAGVEMLVCGTCANYFNLTADVAVGTISNMYDIAGLMSRAGRLIQP